MATLTGTTTGAGGSSAGYAQSCDFHVEMWGQSNDVGFSDYTATGGSGDAQTGSDATAYLLFGACSFRQLSSTAPTSSGAQTYNINTGTGPLGPYAAAGGNNNGAEQGLGRDLVKYGLCKRPYIGKTGIGSSSIPGHWAKASNFPTTGTTVYQTLVNNWNASVAETGRNIDVIVHQIGETDANTPSRVTNAIADITAMYTNLRADVPGAANAIVVIVMVNPFAVAVGDGDVTGYRAQQVLFVSGDPTGLSVLVDPFDIPLRSDPHYGSGGYWSLGDRILLAIRDKMFPGRSLNLGAEPFAYFQAEDPGATAQAAPSNASPRGPFDELENDVQVLVATSYTQASTHTLTTAAGFLPLIAQFESAVGANHHAMSVWYRVVKRASMSADAAGKLRMPIPTMQFTSSTLNIARILTVRGADPANPFAVLLTGANNLNNTALAIPSSSTPTTVPANSLALILAAHTGNFNVVASTTNATLTNLTVQRDSRFNPGAATVGLAFLSGDVPGTSLNQTNLTMASASPNVGAVLVMNPAPATLTGASTGAGGVSLANTRAIATGTGTTPGDAGTSAASALAAVTATGSSAGARGLSASAAQALATASGSTTGAAGTSAANVTTSSPTQPTLAGNSAGAGGTSAAASQVVVTLTGAAPGRVGVSSGILQAAGTAAGANLGVVGASSATTQVAATLLGDTAGDCGVSVGQMLLINGPLLVGASRGAGGVSVGAATSPPLAPRFATAVRLLGVWADGDVLAQGVPANTATPIDWPSGQAAFIEMDLVDQDGQPFIVDLTDPANQVVLSIRQTFDSDVLFDALAKGADVARFRWFVPAEATRDLRGKLVYDVWAVRGGFSRQVVSTSYFNINPRIRR